MVPPSIHSGLNNKFFDFGEIMFECENLVHHIHFRIVVQMEFGKTVFRFVFGGITRPILVRKKEKKIAFVFQKSFSTIYFYFSIAVVLTLFTEPTGIKLNFLLK